MPEQTYEPYVWRGKPLKAVGDIIDAVFALSSEEEAQEFITGYRSVSPHADANAGYVTGYGDPQRGEELRRWMGAAHPIFGMGTPTASEALAAGMESADAR